ncbi:hypothetical protein JW848_06085 [Candidatus Bipolaricaulota bacterium]|nr:hypothetical protein [Candidatus Bipolaricaulota bacterium]
MNSLDFDAPLLETIFQRRTKRFPVGGELRSKRGRLAFSSEGAPYSLSEEETALLCFSATGTTGASVEEIRHLMGHLTVTGRTVGSPCASVPMQLLFTDDAGTYYYRSAPLEDAIPGRRVRIACPDDRRLILDDFRRHTIKLSDGRLDIPRSAIGAAFESLVNLPGTTLFFPISDTTQEYINLLMTGLAQFKWQLWDEVRDCPAGVGSWIRDGTLDGPRMTIYQYDQMLPWLCNLEAGMAFQNSSLVATALGLGAFLMHTIDLPTVMRCIGMRFEPVDSAAFPQAAENPVGIDGLLEGHCPPYMTVDEAVDTIAQRKWGDTGIYGRNGYDLLRPAFYDEIVEMTRSFCNYVFSTYGRLPKYTDAMFIPALFQIHHLEAPFYEKHFPEYVTPQERDHKMNWHAT